jgi:hypothetical protein
VRGEALCVDAIGIMTNTFADGRPVSRGVDHLRGLNVSAFAERVTRTTR